MKDVYIGFHETMSGFYRDLMGEGKKRKFEFTVTATAPFRKLANPMGKDFMLTALEGIVTMEGICEDAAIRDGKLLLDFLDKRQLVYSFNFQGDGAECSYSGKKRISLQNPLESMTTLFGSIECARNGIMQDMCSSVCYFSLKDLPTFMLSFMQMIKVK